MINFNGNISEDVNVSLTTDNRGYHYGDAVFETIKVVNNAILFWEDHYFRLMASMRILRMEIPMNFTLEFLEEEILKTVVANGYKSSNCRVKLSVFRNEGGLYLPDNKSVSFFVTTNELVDSSYSIDKDAYNVELFKDYFIAPNLLSTLKTTSRVVNVLGSIYAKENEYDNCLLLNTDKQAIEALNGNIFLIKDKVIKTAPLSDGCIKGIMRKQIIDLIHEDQEYTLEESSISAFELQKADEIFITNVITGIQPVTNYRKKSFSIESSKKLIEALNAKINYTKDPQAH